MIDQFVAILDNANLDLAADDIADALWLALQIEARVPSAPKLASQSTEPAELTKAPSTPTEAPQAPLLMHTESGSAPSAERAIFPRGAHAELEAQADVHGLPFRSPAATALPGSLAIGRALRPLLRRQPSRSRFILDVRATVQRIAEEQIARIGLPHRPGGYAWPPVLRPASTPWFDVALVADASASMVVWHQTIDELRRLLERHGAFRDVRAWSMVTDSDDGTIHLYAGHGPAALRRRPRSPRELIDPAGRRLVLVVSDCVSTGWYEGKVVEPLMAWGRHHPLVIVQVLPERLWPATALGLASAVQVHAPYPGAPNTRLVLDTSWQWLNAPLLALSATEQVPRRVTVPLVTLAPEVIGEWAKLATGAGSVWVPGFVLEAREGMGDLASFDLDKDGRTAEERVQDFRIAASPDAYRLAELLAVMPLTLPVIRLVRETMLPHARQAQVAEVFLSGLLRVAVPHDQPDEVVYDFVDGVRDVLRAAAPVTDQVLVFDRISRFVATRLGQSFDFLALLADPSAVDGLPVSGKLRPFAQMATTLLHNFGGELALRGARLRKRIARELEREEREMSGVRVAPTASHTSLPQTSLPVIEVIVEQSEWRGDGLYYCHLLVANRGEIAADDVRIHVEESPVGEYEIVDDNQFLGTLFTDQPRGLHVRIKPTPLDLLQEGFTLHIRLQYQIPQRPGPEERSIRLRVGNFVSGQQPFQPIVNPYIVGGIVQDPRLFRGRNELIDALLIEVANPHQTGSAVIFGQKRVGKSSLLYHLARNLPAFVIPISFDIPTVLIDLPRNITPDSTAGNIREDEVIGRFLFALMRRIVRDCNNRNILVEPMNWDDFMAQPGPAFQFRNFLEQFRNRSDRYRLLLLFDEFTTLSGNITEATIENGIMKLLKLLIEQNYLSCVLCGHIELYDLVILYANQLAASQPRQLDYLAHDAAVRLIDEPIRTAGDESRFSSDEVIDKIIDLTAGSPFYIQMFCRRLVEYANNMQIQRITAADIDQITRSLIDGPERIDLVQFDNLYRYKDDPRWDDRSALLEGLIMHLLAHETATKTYAPADVLYRRVQDFVTDKELDETLSRLEQRRTIIRQIEDRTKTRRGRQPLHSRQYRIRVDLFRRWLLANQPLDEEALLSFKRKLNL